MTREIYVLDARGERQTERCWDTQTPGLVVTRERRLDGTHGEGWVITHEPSGCSVGAMTDDPENAMRVAAFLGSDDDKCPIDWTRDARWVQADERVKKRNQEARPLVEAWTNGPVGHPIVRVNP